MKFNLDVYGKYKIAGEDAENYNSEFSIPIELTYPEYLGILKICNILSSRFDEVVSFEGIELHPCSEHAKEFKRLSEEYNRGSSEVDLLLKTYKFANHEKKELSSVAHNVLIYHAILDELSYIDESFHGKNIIEFFNSRFNRGLPFTPLIGNDDEWELVNTDTKKMFKNNRYPKLFKFEYPNYETPLFVDLDRFVLYNTNRNAGDRGDRFPSAIKVAIAKELAKLYPITFPYNPGINQEVVHVKVFSTKGTTFSNCDTIRLIYKTDYINSNKQHQILKNYKYENTNLVEISQEEYNERKEQHKKNKHVLKKELKEAFDESGDE